MGSLGSLDRCHKNRLKDVPYLAKICGIKSPDYILEIEMTDVRKSIMARRRIILSPRTFSSTATISLGMTTTLTRTTAARVTVPILRGISREVTFTKSAPWSAVRAVAEHQTVSQSLVTLTISTGKLVNKGASRGSFVVLLLITGAQLAVSESLTGPMPVSDRHILELDADR